MSKRKHINLFNRCLPIWEAFKNEGWNVRRDGNEVTLSNYSPAGEELYETLYLDGNKTIPQQLWDIYDGFDEEEHATMWLNAKRSGASGIPSISVLVHDAEKITDMYARLYSIVQEKYKEVK